MGSQSRSADLSLKSSVVEQGYVRDDKQSIKAYLGSGEVVRFAQAFITG